MRERWCWDRAQQALVPAVQGPCTGQQAPTVMRDVTPFVYPGDGSLVTSRSHVRSIEKRYGVRQVGTEIR